MSDRAQTTLDFAFGVSLFAAVLLFVFVFVPGLLSPFTGGLHEETVSANRIADGLSQGQFGTPAEPGVLDESCTTWFFEHAGGGTESSPSDCRYDGETLQERLGLQDRQPVNVTVSGNVSAGVEGTTTLCWNEDGRGVAETASSDCSAGDVTLTAGGSAPSANDDAITATRVASLAGEDVTIEVELW